MVDALSDMMPQTKDSEKGPVIPVKVVRDEEPVRVTDRRFWAQNESSKSAPESNYSFKPSYVEDLERKLADSQRRVEEVMATYREYKAENAVETQRAKERIQNEYNRRLSEAKADIVRKFLDVLENFERALEAAKSQQTFASLLEGVQLIRNQFMATLAALGVSELEVKGRLFDPEIAEAVGTVHVCSEAEDQQIIEVVGKGYVLNQALVRPAKVRVGAYLPTDEQKSTA